MPTRVDGKPHFTTARSGAFHTWAVVAIGVLFVVLGLLNANSILPQPDEAVYANPGYNWTYNGHVGTTLYEWRGYVPESLTQRTYWQFPGYFFFTRLWFQVVGFGLQQVRFLSVLFGLLGLISWYWIGRKLSGSATAGLLGMSLVSVNFFYTLSASTGRMDMMTSGLGSAALASYLLLRKRSLGQGLFVSHVLATLAILTHPTGALYWLGLVFLIFFYDRANLSVRMLALAAIGPVLGLAAFGAYILPSPDAFLEQMRSTLPINRDSFTGEGLSSIPVIRSLQLEWRYRYVGPFGLAPGVTVVQHLKAVFLLVSALAVFLSLGWKRFRQQSGLLPLAVLTLIAVLFLALASPSKFFYYLVHVSGFMSVAVGVFLYWSGQMLGRRRWIAGAAFAVVFMLQLSGVVYRLRQDPYHKFYVPVLSLVKANTTPKSVIMSTGELWFGLEHDRYMIYDYKLGALSGVEPNLIVWAKTEREFHEQSRLENPPLYQYVQHILDTGRVIHEDEYYQVYLR